MNLPKINTRLIVIIGYCILVSLAIVGFIMIYLEVLKSNRENNDNPLLKKELMDLNNTLTTMYQAEGTANLLAFVEDEKLRQEYNSLTINVFDKIDSLQRIVTNSDIYRNLDSLSVLLLKKRNNSLEMIQLMRQIDQNILKESVRKSIISRTDFSHLDSLLVNVTQVKEDTIRLVSEKKSFFRRIKDVINPASKDTVTQISKSAISKVEEVITPLMTDTIVDYIQKIDQKAKRKNNEIIQQLIARQHELYIINELTGIQINAIVNKLKELEFQTNLDILKKKNELLARSTSFVAIIGLMALFVAICFMTWTLKSLNEAQKWQKSIQEAKKNVEDLLASREQLIYTITHDIKAPTSSIIGFLDLLLEDNTISQKQQYYINNMNSSASHILNLVKNLLDFQSMEKTQPQLNKVPFSPTLLVNNIYESFLPLARKKKIALELNSSLSEDDKFLSDPYYIRLILNNLILNAIKFTPEEGQIFLLSSLDSQNQWKISVQDTGPGIEPADHAKIFEEFIRLDETKKKVEGSGLGLPISKKLALLLDGTIELESLKGAGSIFTLIIPIIPIIEDVQANKQELPVGTTRVLFIDDDVVQLNLLSELMKKEKISFACCSSASEALQKLQEESFDIIFSDLYIPDKNGFELIKQIRNMSFPQAATLPIIAFSAENQKTENELEANSFDGFLFKPFKAGQLLEIIETYTSFKRNNGEKSPEKDEFGLENILHFVSNDPEAAVKIIDSLIEEMHKDRETLDVAFREEKEEIIKQLSHKMLTLMRMISAKEIVSILNDFEKGNISEEKKVTLFRLIEEKLDEAEVTRKILDKMIKDKQLNN